MSVVRLFGCFVFVLAVCLAQNSTIGLQNSTFAADGSSESVFSECPHSHTGFCYHGTCRFLVSEWSASCICYQGYVGTRCQYMDLLQVMAGDPRSFTTIVALSVTFLVVLLLVGNTCLGVYLCRIRRESNRLALLKNMEIQAWKQQVDNLLLMERYHFLGIGKLETHEYMLMRWNAHRDT
ncbi:protransforming growth factor alpha [Bombina bombina]|uniref:protransforming growth factor alpha n=1 Tax=Bombina bombina TaxID=8345 RepID=UPI00235AEBC3|nr:protransforming growth factor alpha [Bombina bombina]